MKEINYWKIVGISVILTVILYVITILLLTVGDPSATESLWVSVWGLAVIIISIYSSKKIKIRKEIVYCIIPFLLISVLPLPLFIMSVSITYFIWILIRVEKKRCEE